MILFENRTTDGNSPEYQPGFPVLTYKSHTLLVAGVPNGATVQVESTLDNVLWESLPGISLTAIGALNFEVRAIALRVTITSSGASTDLYVAIQSSIKDFDD